MQKRVAAHLLLAFDKGEAAGMIISFEGFSTFVCRPLLNIHDIVVTKRHRGKGLAKNMLQMVQEMATDHKKRKLKIEGMVLSLKPECGTPLPLAKNFLK